MRACWVMVPILLFVCGCEAATSPSSPASYNAGTWLKEGWNNPGGVYSMLSLDTVAGTVHGQGLDAGIAGAVLDSFTVAGRLTYPNFALVFTYNTGTLGTYTGQFVNDTVLTGTFVAPGYPPTDVVRFYQRGAGF